MSVLYNQLNSELMEALKQKQEVRVSTLRFLLSAIKNKIIDLRPSGKELTDEDVLGVITKQVKQRQESITEFTKANRMDLVEKEQAELEVLKVYLPEQMSTDEIEKIVIDAITETQAKGQSDMGKVMALVTPKTKGKADGSIVAAVVKKHLIL